MSAVFFGFFVCVSGVIGRSCDSKNDFSHLIGNVVDVPTTWNNTYPLGWALLENGSQRVTVSEVLDRCERGRSLYVVFDLEKRYSLDEFCISQGDMVCLCTYMSMDKLKLITTNVHHMTCTHTQTHMDRWNIKIT